MPLDPPTGSPAQDRPEVSSIAMESWEQGSHPMRPEQPLLSVVVPVCDGSEMLAECLAALAASDLPREAWELIVVDDGSLDSTDVVAAKWADVLVRLPGPPNGPAYARNRGVEASVGEIVVFVDADVRVHPDALRRFAWTFAQQPELGAAFGSYDSSPVAPDDVSQYRNLLHHFIHQRDAGAADAFWTACGAVRRDAFQRAGRFDEWHFLRPQIEDIEFGYRLRGLGYPITLDPGIQATHLKGWTFKEAVLADFRDRSTPWIRLLLEKKPSSRALTLNFRPAEWINAALMGVAFLLLLGAAASHHAVLASFAALPLSVVLISNFPLYRFFCRRRGFGFALRVTPIHLFYYLSNALAALWAWMLYHLVGPPGPPPEIQAYSEKGLKTWPPLPAKVADSTWLGGTSSPSKQ